MKMAVVVGIKVCSLLGDLIRTELMPLLIHTGTRGQHATSHVAVRVYRMF